jgi:hypothetical protein
MAEVVRQGVDVHACLIESLGLLSLLLGALHLDDKGGLVVGSAF